MRVRIKLFGVLRRDRFKEEEREFPPGTTVADVVSALALPRTLLGTALVRGVHARLDAPLADGDELTLLPILGGG